MFIAVDKNSILNLFKVDTFSELESVLELMSPSLVEYHLMSFLNGENTSYFDKKDVEEAGLVKFDFLGLRTLTIIDWALKIINARAAAGNR